MIAMRRASKRRQTVRQARLVARGGRIKVVRIGARHAPLGDLYAKLLHAPWATLAAGIAIVYMLINLAFAAAYMAVGDGIENAHPGVFRDAFFFSVQTLATIGYGKLVPVSLAANILVTIEALSGFVFFAVTMGLVFAKFSRPTARVLFSDVAVIGPYNGKPHFMLRMANERGNRIVEAEVNLVVLRDEVTAEGVRMRRFHDLSLTRSHVPVMQYTWTVMHALDKDSPLFGVTPEMLREQQAEIIVSLIGHDETLAQTIHARHSYVADEIACNALFEDVLKRGEGMLEINLEKFHAVRTLPDL